MSLYGPVIVELERELAELDAKAAATRALLDLLRQRAGDVGTTSDPRRVKPPPAKKKSRRGQGGGRPVIDPNDTERARRAAAMRKRRARLKAAAAETAPKPDVVDDSPVAIPDDLKARYSAKRATHAD